MAAEAPIKLLRRRNTAVRRRYDEELKPSWGWHRRPRAPSNTGFFQQGRMTMIMSVIIPTQKVHQLHGFCWSTAELEFDYDTMFSRVFCFCHMGRGQAIVRAARDADFAHLLVIQTGRAANGSELSASRGEQASLAIIQAIIRFMEGPLLYRIHP